MRALAARLGVTTMALYNHVDDRDDLVRAVADAAVRELDIPDGGPWQDRLRACYRALRRVCLGNPASIPLIEAADTLDPRIFRPLEITLRALRDAGCDDAAAMNGYSLLIAFTMGQVAYQVRGTGRGLDPVAALHRGLLSRAEFPTIHEVVPVDTEWDFEAAFEAGLETIIRGLVAQPRAPSP